MTTLSADKVRDLKLGDLNDIPMVAADIIYGGAAVGIVKASGHARPLTSADDFAGFAQRQVDNAAGAAADKNIKVVRKGIVTLPISGAVITDIGAHVWASDDDTFGFTGVGGIYIGKVVRFVSSGIVDVQFDAGVMLDPFGSRIHELKSANYTVDAEDSGKVIWVDTDAVVITLPAVGGIGGVIVANAAAYGVSGVAVSPNASDMIEGADITAADNKDIINTKATAQRGDFVDIWDGDANGWLVSRRKGVWAREA
jgi:hypothetical protein